MYDHAPCLHGIDFELGPGEIVAIVGANGSGKTTLLDIMTGFIPPDSGRIELHGTSVSLVSHSLGTRYGIIRLFQAPRVFGQMSVWDSLLLAIALPSGGPESLSWICPLPWITARVKEYEKDVSSLLHRIGWENRVDELAGDLSYGEQKLLAALQLRLNSGLIAVCDEPTAGLDTTQSSFVMELLEEWLRESDGRSVVLATHDLDSAQSHGDRLLTLSDGVLSEQSTGVGGGSSDS